MLSQSKKLVCRVLEAPQASHGERNRTFQIVGHEKLKTLDPFVIFDEYEVELPGGYPDHPHRGFETITYILEGSTRQEDCFGNKATLHQGDVLYMVAGQGIVHAEMPNPKVRGLQLWINLTKTEKDTEPSFLKLRKDEVSVAKCDGVEVAVISGMALNNQAPMRARNSMAHFYVFTVQPGAPKTQHSEPNFWNCLAYVITGTMEFNGQKVEAKQEVIFEDGEFINFQNKGDGVAQFALIAGKPLLQPIIVEDTFVVSSQEEAAQALEDFRTYKNGFEKADGWKSKIAAKVE